MFAGDKIDQVMAVGLKEGEDVDDLAAEFSRRLEENNIDSDTELIVLADIVGNGGSPLTTVKCNVLEKRGLSEGAVILGGMNLPMALNSLVIHVRTNFSVTTVLSEARNAVQEFKMEVGDDEEDDI